MDAVLNIGLLKNPLNWVIILLMLLIAYLGAEVIFNQFASPTAQG